MIRRRRLFALRPDERRDAWAAFLFLLAFVASLTLLETARDTLFLARVPARRLPWMYISIAAISLLVVNLQARYARLAGPVALGVWTFFTAVTTLCLSAVVKMLGSAGVYVLYVWSGVLTSLVLVHFWTLLGSVFTVTQAKRVYGFIGSGSVLGGIAGSGVARALFEVTSPRGTAMLAAAGFGTAAVLPLLFTRGAARAAEHDRPPTATLLENARFAVRHPYARLIVPAMAASAACVTIADYVFKSMAAASIPKAELGAWLATVYLFLNLASLAAQLVLTSWILRRFSVATAFAVLPALLFAGGLGVAVTSGMAAPLFVKVVDGSLRYSLHKTASEMLFLPLTGEVRRRVKALTDVAGHRGGQALASILILIVAKMAPLVVAAALAALAALWIAVAASLRAPYLEQFRGRLRGDYRVRRIEYPELDLASLETLIAALDSHVDNEVIAALDVLERERRVRLVPTLILYHPSEAVVERALAVFARARRADAVPVVDRLIENPSPRVRAAAIATRSILDPNARPLLLRMSFEEAPEVRATITVNLIAMGEIYGDDARERIAALLSRGRVSTRIALAEAIARRNSPGFVDVLVALSRAPEADVRRSAAEAMAMLHDPAFIAPAIELLVDEPCRRYVRDLLVSHGDAAFAPLVAALEDTRRHPTARWRIAQEIALFDQGLAAAALLAQLAREKDGAVRFQLIRGLEALVRRHPDLVLDRELLEETIRATVRRAYRYLNRGLLLIAGAARDPSRRTPGHALLARVLQDKRRNATDRLFRLLGLAYPLEDFVQMHDGIMGGRREARASAFELVGNVLADPLRAAVIGLVDDVADEARLESAGGFFQPMAMDYEELMAHLLESSSESVLSITVFHLGELQLAPFKDRLVALRGSARLEHAASDLELAISRIDRVELPAW